MSLEENTTLTPEASTSGVPDLPTTPETPKPKTPTEEREERTEPIIKEILESLLKYDAKLSEIDYILSRVIASVNVNQMKANRILYKVENRDVTMKIVDDILKGGQDVDSS